MQPQVKSRRTRGRSKEDGPDRVDVHVGARVRQRRTILGMSQEKLGNALGLTFQQVQKYERGANRIGASRLHHLSEVLDVPVSYFFEELPREGAGHKGFAEEKPEAYEPDPLAKRETLELVRAYYKITDPAMRRKLFELVKAMAHASLERR